MLRTARGWVVAITAGLLTACQALPAPTVDPAIAATPDAAVRLDTNRIAVVGAGGSVYTISPDGSDRIDVNDSGTIPEAALAWSPDDSLLAFSLISSNRSELITVDARGEGRAAVYQDARLAAPFYLYWSPDSRRIAFLTPHPQERMSLNVAQAGAVESSQSIARGQPNYFSWAADGQRLALHIGGQIGYVGTYAFGDDAPQRRSEDPAIFQSPAWSPDGDAFLFARAGLSRNELVRARGEDEDVLLKYLGGIAFAWSPDAARIAYSVLDPGRSRYTGLALIDAQTGDTSILIQDSLLAFFWSPDGRRIAYLASRLSEPGSIGRAFRSHGLAAPRLNQSGATIELTWRVVDVESGEVTSLASFEPSDHFVFVVPFFDQYAQSLSFWSPDSRYLLLAGAPLGRERGIYRMDTAVADGDRLTRIGPGEFAVWSWH